MFSLALQAEVKADQQDWRGSEAAYERAMAESKELSLDLLQGLTGVLAADSRPERAVDVIRGAEKTVSKRSGTPGCDFFLLSVLKHMDLDGVVSDVIQRFTRDRRPLGSGKPLALPKRGPGKSLSSCRGTGMQCALFRHVLGFLLI